MDYDARQIIPTYLTIKCGFGGAIWPFARAYEMAYVNWLSDMAARLMCRCGRAIDVRRIYCPISGLIRHCMRQDRASMMLG